jgi:hypothetical protein
VAAREASGVVAEHASVAVDLRVVAVDSAVAVAAMAGASSQKSDLYFPPFEGLAVAAPQKVFCPMLALL